jgi:hypothetical protein
MSQLKVDHSKDDKDGIIDRDKKVWAAGWRPEPYPPREKSWELWQGASGHQRVGNYMVVRNDENAYSFLVELHVTDKQYERTWEAKPEELQPPKIVDGLLILCKEGESTGAFMKIPKGADPSGELVVDTPEKGGYYVTIPKLGAKQKPAPIDPVILGTKLPKYPPDAQVFHQGKQISGPPAPGLVTAKS